MPPSVLHKWADEDATDSRRLQDGDLYHEWFVAYLKVWTRGVNKSFPGYLVVIHDLDLISMCDDLAGFKPNMYRLMQLSGKVVFFKAVLYFEIVCKSSQFFVRPWSLLSTTLSFSMPSGTGLKSSPTSPTEMTPRFCHRCGSTLRGGWR